MSRMNNQLVFYKILLDKVIKLIILGSNKKEYYTSVSFIKMICTQLFLLNAMAITMGLYVIVTLPFVIESITNIKLHDDDDVKDRQFRKEYLIPLNSVNITEQRGLRGMIDSEEYMDDDVDDDFNITVNINNESLYIANLRISPYYIDDDDAYNYNENDLSFDKDTVYIIDNIDRNIIYAVIKNYCVINTEKYKERRDM